MRNQSCQGNHRHVSKDKHFCCFYGFTQCLNSKLTVVTLAVRNKSLCWDMFSLKTSASRMLFQWSTQSVEEWMACDEFDVQNEWLNWNRWSCRFIKKRMILNSMLMNLKLVQLIWAAVSFTRINTMITMTSQIQICSESEMSLQAAVV